MLVAVCAPVSIHNLEHINFDMIIKRVDVPRAVPLLLLSNEMEGQIY